MKRIFTLFLFTLLSVQVFAQETDCDDPNKIACCQAGNAAIIAITPLAELKCKDQKAKLYSMFPQIPIYKGFLFNQISLCTPGSTSAGNLQFDYCIAKTRLHMSVTISDFADAFYQTDAGKSQVNLIKTIFDAGPSPILRTYPSRNKKFDKSYIAMPGQDDKVKYVNYEGLHQNRYWIHIVVEGDRFKLPTAVDDFLEDYIKAFTL